MHVGFVVNPVAGMGGRVGLKGTDGKVAEAVARGAEPRAPDRARRALERLAAVAPEARISTAADPMGERLVREAGFEPIRVVDPFDGATPDPTETTADHTARVVEAFVAGDDPVDLVLFVGGDGTATDVATVLERTGAEIPMLGVPAGVKVYSSVFAVSPEDAAAVAATFSRTERREVMDIDEDAYREGRFTGTPSRRARPGRRGPPVVETDRERDRRVARRGRRRRHPRAGGRGRHLRARPGVDGRRDQGGARVRAVADRRRRVARRGGYRPGRHRVGDPRRARRGERDRRLADRGQGFVFGRGNPQLSPAVIRRCDLRIVASRTKLDDVRALRVDTDDPDLDAELAGWVRVRVGKFETRMMKIA